MDCLENIIKLSRTECPCVDEDKPETFNQGQSEVYLDELEGLNLSILSGAEGCGPGSIWDMMHRARINATLALKTDLLSVVENNFIPLRPNYSGVLGETTFTTSLNISNEKAGQLLKFPRILGGKMIISRIGLMMSTTTPIVISVFDNDEHTVVPIATFTIGSTANTLTYGNLETPLTLPLWSKNIHDLEYYVVYTIGAFQPKNNKTQCVPCSGGVKNVAWQNWLKVYGIAGDGTEYSTFQTTDELNGLVLDVQLKCEGARVICSDEYPLDFDTAKAMQIAYAIRFKAGAILLDEILSSPNINRYTMMDTEKLYGKRNQYRATYEKWVTYLADNTPIINNDCWICKPNSLMSRGTILK